jgi:hypothetical protein
MSNVVPKRAWVILELGLVELLTGKHSLCYHKNGHLIVSEANHVSGILIYYTYGYLVALRQRTLESQIMQESEAKPQVWNTLTFECFAGTVFREPILCRNIPHLVPGMSLVFC